MSDKTKHEIMKEGFELWQKLAISRLGITTVGVADDKKEALNVLMEAAFEAGFSFGCHTGMNDVMSDLIDHVKKNGKVVTNGSIMVPEVGHA